MKITEPSHGLVDVSGFECAGVACDIRGKQDGRLDVALVRSKFPCQWAGVFTRHAFAAAPVLLGREQLATGNSIEGIVVNSGNANACCGEAGMADALAMRKTAADVMGLVPEAVAIGSTGRIGERLPLQNLLSGIREAAGKLSRAPASGLAAADAILTSDTRRKVVTVELRLDGVPVRIAGMAKGAGMIEPNMATMLAYIATDAAIPSSLLQKLLVEAVQGTFNAITVDGDRSTNDTVLLLANGCSGVSLQKNSPGLGEFASALGHVCGGLAEAIVGDGEKITKVVTIEVSGVRDAASAERVARVVGNSLLVKSSWYGNDPNWGRVLDAVGASDVEFEPKRFSMSYLCPDGREVPAFAEGRGFPEKKEAMRSIVANSRFTIRLNLGEGEGRFRLLASDLTEGYVNFNKSE